MIDPDMVTKLLDAIKVRLIASNPDGITIDYALKKDLGTFNGRFVNIYLMTAAKAGPVDRVSDYFDVRVMIANGERYVARGTPPREWVEERIKNELKDIYCILTSPRAELFSEHKFWPQTDDFSVAVNHEMLEENKVFWGEMEILFRAIIQDDLIESSF